MLEMIKEEDQVLLVQNIGKMYRESLAELENEKKDQIREEQGFYLSLSVKEKVDEIVQNLRIEYAIIIQREFLEEKSKNWYEKYFTLEEYNMYKKGAIHSFLHCLYG